MKLKFVIIALQINFSLLFSQASPHGSIQWKCTECHSTNGWNEMVIPMKFDHSKTSYMLYGQHRLAECLDCHPSLRFAGTSKNCYHCHRQEFESTVLPNHVQAGFGTYCERCHSIESQSWQNSFDHNKIDFPLRGAHEGVACIQCHNNGSLRGITVECFMCHKKEYLATTNPNHQTAKFSTNCEMCHRALTWQPAALFPHDSYFPISAGNTHRPGRWNSCGDCHINSGNYSLFECINCHEHNKSSMDRKHQGEVSGYVYQSSACYRCHPKGDAN